MTDINITNENEYLTNVFSRVSELPMTVEQEIQEEVFKQIYIPRTLQELSLEDIEKQKKKVE